MEKKTYNAIAEKINEKRLWGGGALDGGAVQSVASESGRRCDRSRIQAVCEAVGFTDWEDFLETDAESEELDKGKSNSDRSPSPIQKFNHIGSGNFVGRQNELALVHENMQTSGRVAISAVAGMGGVGKTELAIKYAREHEADYPGGIFWLSARGSELAANIIKSFQSEIPQKDFRGRQFSIEEKVAWCWQNWQPPVGQVLVILDDVTELASCKEFIPTINRFRVLITTRLRNLDTNIVEIPLDVLLPEEALRLLTKLVGERRVQSDLKTANELCKWLGYLPLGIELVGRYVAKKPPSFTLATMLQQLKAQRLENEAVDPHKGKLGKTLSTAQLGLNDAFELTWKELNSTTQRVGELLSLFAPEVFSWKWVESSSKTLNWSDLDEAKQQLYDHHLIQWVDDTDKDDSFRMHPLIREFLQIKLTEDSEQADDIKRAFVETFVAIAKTIPDSPTQNLITSVKDAIPHLEEVAKKLTNIIEDENLIWVFSRLNVFYQEQGLYPSALSWCEQGLSIVRSRFGEEHPNVATSYNNLALLYVSQRRYSEAEPLYQKALVLYQQFFGEEHPYVVTSYNNMAQLYASQGRYREAEPLLQKALALCKQFFGEEHPSVAISYNCLAYLYNSQGRYSEAEPLLQKALALCKQLFGEEHPHVVTSYNNMAQLYASQGRYSEAEPLLQKALTLYQQLFGEEHPHVANSYRTMAYLYTSQGRYSEAEPLLQKALALCKQLFGEEHPHVADSYRTMAYLYTSQGRYSEAESVLQKALALCKQLFGEEHPHVANSYDNMAQLHASQGRYSEAESVLQKALALYQQLFGEEHPQIANNYFNLAILYDHQGQYSKSEPLFQQALEMRKRLLGEEHSDIAETLSNLAYSYSSQGRYSEAEPLCQQALEMRKRLLGEEHPSTASSINTLARLYNLQGQYSDAEPLYKQALKIRKRLLGEEHRSVADSLNGLANLYFSQKKYDEAQDLYLEALRIFEKKLGENHPDTISCRNSLKHLQVINSKNQAES